MSKRDKQYQINRGEGESNCVISQRFENRVKNLVSL